ncbi:MAG: helix-turn-helix domain-containing protein [Actinobacteria bacterium]|nr:helix-turn-helix domain-containing protein [Actinomycetota bacterium]
MKEPIFVRQLSEEERKTLKAGLRSPDAFIMRRCQILLANADGMNAYQIARTFGCNDQSVRNAIHKFNEQGLQATLKRGSRRPHTIHAAFDCEQAKKRLKEVLHQSPRNFAKPTSLWTLELAAQLSFEEGLTKKRVSGETIRATLARMGVNWRRAKRWMTSPDPEYARKKACATG